MDPKLFPFPLVNGVEGLHARHRRSGRLIYLTVVFGLLLGATALPFIDVEVNSQSRGILRPTMKLTPVTTPVSGQVTYTNLRENATVTAGDTLLIVSTAELSAEADHLRQQLNERNHLLQDLHHLTASAPDSLTIYPTLTTDVYQRDYRDYRRRSDALHLKLQHATRELDRQTELIRTGAIARMAYEQSAYELTLLQNQQRQLSGQQAHVWTQDLQRIRRERAELRQQLTQLHERARHYVVTAPVDGQLTQTGGLQAGAFASAGQQLAHISPDGELRVEAYVSPSDIGLLREGLPVRLQLDAFNYNQWGLAEATLAEIGKDVTEVDGQAAFLVTCTLHNKVVLQRII
ncbi:hypothetical protein LEM8419_01051 [Neolewinella maritima]|uniref:HlyD family efflux transporter periplasmic adaptor subunit n=1 Tax=Neolewinella maritima TaxID=1383882 RepID=A0ABN8F4R0_9BACT|nr:HlyD family efflux transporter periplasmic adaptor subunit [Neolewinella maritima]CAH0999751.1 hypothetical protein LEM8419_01051 [Neolewinella maritima]